MRSSSSRHPPASRRHQSCKSNGARRGPTCWAAPKEGLYWRRSWSALLLRARFAAAPSRRPAREHRRGSNLLERADHFPSSANRPRTTTRLNPDRRLASGSRDTRPSSTLRQLSGSTGASKRFWMMKLRLAKSALDHASSSRPSSGCFPPRIQVVRDAASRICGSGSNSSLRISAATLSMSFERSVAAAPVAARRTRMSGECIAETMPSSAAGSKPIERRASSAASTILGSLEESRNATTGRIAAPRRPVSATMSRPIRTTLTSSDRERTSVNAFTPWSCSAAELTSAAESPMRSTGSDDASRSTRIRDALSSSTTPHRAIVRAAVNATLSSWAPSKRRTAVMSAALRGGRSLRASIAVTCGAPESLIAVEKSSSHRSRSASSRGPSARTARSRTWSSLSSRRRLPKAKRCSCLWAVAPAAAAVNSRSPGDDASCSQRVNSAGRASAASSRSRDRASFARRVSSLRFSRSWVHAVTLRPS